MRTGTRSPAARDAGRGWGAYYHARLARLYRMQISPGQRVLEIGCGRGDLLAALEPGEGVGIDFSTEMIVRARRAYPHLVFIEADAHAIPLRGDSTSLSFRTS